MDKQRRGTVLQKAISLAVMGMALPVGSAAQDVEEIVVVGVTPLGGPGLELNKVPFNVQTVSATDLAQSLSLDITDHLNSNAVSVNLNAAQNNPLQPDLQFRGFTASPLLGLPQGVAVYQDGVRINEPLGDAVNWDMLPESAISSMTLLSGANPVFGLNALGGAININMKNGFNFNGNEAEVYAGDWGRSVGTIESGGNNGTWGYYANISYFEEDGWRDLSDSDVLNFYGSVSWRDGERSALDFAFQDGQSELTGNGAAPVGLLELDREAIFTAPDITENDVTLFSLNGSHRFTDSLQFSGTVYRRENDTDSFNGDASEFELCEFSGGAQALLEEADDIEDALENELGIELDDVCEGEDDDIASFGDLEEFIEQQALLAGLNPEDFELEDAIDELSGSDILSDEAINNISNRQQISEGLEGQLTFLDDIAGFNNQLVVGFGYFNGESRFRSVTELADLNPETRSTAGLGTGTFFDEAATDIATQTETWSLYFTNALDLTDTLTLTLAGRFNESDVTLRDKSGERPELNGDHGFSRFNPSLGLTWEIDEGFNAYISYNESNRVPTPIELSCNEEIFSLAQARAEAEGDDPDDVEFECRLPNAFLADPPLNDVVTRNVEAGFRLQADDVNYHLGVFQATNEDDIIFQTTGRATGLFANVDKTRRMGFESALSGNLGSLNWFASYSYVQATFEDNFQALSPNHDFADEEGTISVQAGDRIPGIPNHQVKLGANYRFDNDLLIAAELIYNSDQRLRGDESNQLDDVDGFAIMNLRAIYQINDNISIFARINNLFDTEYESFGLLGEDPSEVIDSLNDLSPVFLGAGAPRAAWVGARIRF
ncbi:MAG: TonB-dependent receptor [Gammaproteobacteria bacterium]|nr:TonB-dependent receptor [Gammaproteobacteria bacterium]